MPAALALAECIHSHAGSAIVGLIAQPGVPCLLHMHLDLVQTPLQQGCSAPANSSSSCAALTACLPLHTAHAYASSMVKVYCMHYTVTGASVSGVHTAY